MPPPRSEDIPHLWDCLPRRLRGSIHLLNKWITAQEAHRHEEGSYRSCARGLDGRFSSTWDGDLARGRGPAIDRSAAILRTCRRLRGRGVRAWIRLARLRAGVAALGRAPRPAGDRHLPQHRLALLELVATRWPAPLGIRPELRGRRGDRCRFPLHADCSDGRRRLVRRRPARNSNRGRTQARDGVHRLSELSPESSEMAYFLTRLQVGDYDSWKPQFDMDAPGARKAALGHRVLRAVEHPGEVYLLVEFANLESARAGRERLLGSGVLRRFADRTDPLLLEEAEAMSYSVSPAPAVARPPFLPPGFTR